MDSKNEELIHNILIKLKEKGKIIGIITHRDSTLKICDEIYEIKKGE
ncbi:hypothetical protein [Marinitoga lauensis]|nr:hypothetical protein [Marinitoga lauensis]